METDSERNLRNAMEQDSVIIESTAVMVGRNDMDREVRDPVERAAVGALKIAQLEGVTDPAEIRSRIQRAILGNL